MELALLLIRFCLQLLSFLGVKVMQRNIFIPWCEWDLGQDHIAFSSRFLAETWLHKQIMQDSDLKEQYPNGYSDLDENGLAGVIAYLLDP